MLLLRVPKVLAELALVEHALRHTLVARHPSQFRLCTYTTVALVSSCSCSAGGAGAGGAHAAAYAGGGRPSFLEASHEPIAVSDVFMLY